MKRLLPIFIPSVEFALAFVVPWEDCIKAVCWSRNPPACSFEFSPSPIFFLAVALPFLILTVYALWRKQGETALLSGFAGVAVLAGTVLLTVDEGIALLAVLLLTPLLQWAGEKVLEVQPGRNEELIWAISTVLSFLAVWSVVRMKLAVSV
ncbi:hypothetical protein [Thermococcus sp. 21S9]|uniref:hypothetical protein n=1 Tax=Thermococcus sp. 21S9 TaxID=1638223 RepID=UPI00143C2346|nr:hypothetical protein [Thermococcus sp. 21S9]NJE53608.1 hypothetical protein [Thermococcus sp. 21S9]